MSVLRLEIGGGGVEHFDVGRGPDIPLQGVEDLGEVMVALGHHGHGDGRPLPPVLVVDLGHRHVVPVPEGVDDGPDGGALRLERPAGRDMQVEAQSGRVHITTLAARRPGYERWAGTCWTGSQDRPYAPKRRAALRIWDDLSFGQCV